MSGDAHGGGHLPQRISPVLVGREAEFAALRDACRSAPSIAVVGGEAGIGKSRLVAEVVTSDGRGVVMVGYCEPVQEPFPLGPVLDAIRSAADRLPPPADLSPVVGALAPYLPEIAPGLPPALAPLGDQEAERHRLFRAVAALLDNVGSVVLVLEDVHWAAASTSDFIAYLATHLPSGLVLMLTVRDEEREVLPIWEALARTRFGPAIQVGLQPLPPSEVGQLARCILGTDSLPQRFVATLAEKTAGIPFVVEEALGMLAAQAESAAAADQTAALTDLAVPAALKDMLLQRLVSLDEHAREVVGAAAVLGVAPDERVLASVVGCGPEELAHPMSQALSVGLLYEDSGRCRFRHPLAQRAVYESLALPTRQLLHRTAAGVLHAEAGPPPVATLAHHYRLAGMEAEFVQNAEAAAALAVSHGDDATAARFLLQAMEADGLSIDDRVRLAGKLGPAAVQGLAQSAALPVLEGLLADSRLPGSSRGRLRFMLGRLLRQQGEAERGYAEIEASLDDLVEVPKQHARALAILAVPLVTAPHLREHLAHCDKAEEVARRSGDTRTDLAVRIARASLRLEIGDPGGWSTVRSLARDPNLREVPRELARACLNWAQEVLQLGDVHRAEWLLSEARQALAEQEDNRLVGVVALVAECVDLAAGRWSGLEARVRRLVADLSEFAAADLDAQFLLGSTLGQMGDPAEAERCLREVVETAERGGAVRPLVPARAALARLLVHTGDPQSAVEESRRGLDEVRAKGVCVWGAGCVSSLVEALNAQGRVEEAQGEVDRLAAGLEGTDAPEARATLKQCQALLARARGSPGVSDDLLEEARTELGSMGLRVDEARVSVRLGQWRCEDGDTRGPAILEHSLRAFAEIGAERDVSRVRQLMRGYDVPVPYPWRGGRASYGLSLSPRETEVARQAADGHTNQEIATALSLSRRTVESHVANALRKLGGHSRRDLKALLES